jgi:hypothetical protein
MISSPYDTTQNCNGKSYDAAPPNVRREGKHRCGDALLLLPLRDLRCLYLAYRSVIDRII